MKKFIGLSLTVFALSFSLFTLPARAQSDTEELTVTILENAVASSVDIEPLESGASATLQSDKPDYGPTDTALITGSGYIPHQTYKMTITSHDEPSVEVTVDVTADETGFIAYPYQLDGLYRANYQVEVRDTSGAVVSTMTFTDKPAGNLDQCANGGVGDPDVPCAGSAWQNGNLGQSQAHYVEGESVPYRALFTGLVAGQTYTATLEYDTTQSGKHATDYLTSYNQTELDADPCTGTGAASCANPGTYAIPVDPFVTGGGVTPIAGNFTLFNGSITGTSSYTRTGTYASSSSTSITITFSPTASGTSVLAWAGHIATRANWGAGSSATSISGSPYHMRLIDFTCSNVNNCSVGNQDRSLSAEAVISPAKITIIKDAQPNGPQDFSFTTTGTGLSAFSLDDDADATLSHTKVFTVTSFGAKSITEASTTGWALTGLSCTENGTHNSLTNLGSRIANLTVEEGEELTCTFVNTLQTAHITLVKSVTNDNGGSAQATDWTLSADGTTPLSGVTGTAEVTNVEVLAGTYTLSESGPAGYDAGSWSCVINASAPVIGSTVQLAGGDTATCTIINNDSAPSLTLIKQVTNNNGGTATPADWTLTATGPSALSGAGPSVASDATFQIGSYDLSETGLSGYSAGDWTCIGGTQDDADTITLGLGEQATCTIINDDIAPTLIIHKECTPTSDTGLFNLTVDDENVATDVACGGDTGTLTVDAGTYVVGETGGTGTVLDEYTSAVSGDCSANGSVTLKVGENKSCTITNTRKGHIVVDKITLPSGDSTSFSFTTTGAGFDGFSLTDQAEPKDQLVVPGAYTLAESAVAGWNSDGGVCDNGETPTSLDVEPGETVTCTFTNTKLSSLTIVKDAQPNDLQDFDFSGTLGAFTLDDDDLVADKGLNGDIDQPVSKAFTGLVPATYTVMETEPNSFWALQGVTCVDSAQQTYPVSVSQTSAMITLQPGVDVTCTFANKKLGPTRTQGFWQNHTAFTSSVFASKFPGGMMIGSGPHRGLITNVLVASQSQLFGAYYSNIAKTTTNKQRTALDKARMQLLQQLVTAKLNCAQFGCSSTIMGYIASADSAYAGGSSATILIYNGVLDAYNNSGDTVVIGAVGSATPKLSQGYANKVFWDLP